MVALFIHNVWALSQSPHTEKSCSSKTMQHMYFLMSAPMGWMSASAFELWTNHLDCLYPSISEWYCQLLFKLFLFLQANNLCLSCIMCKTMQASQYPSNFLLNFLGELFFLLSLTCNLQLRGTLTGFSHIGLNFHPQGDTQLVKSGWFWSERVEWMTMLFTASDHFDRYRAFSTVQSTVTLTCDHTFAHLPDNHIIWFCKVCPDLPRMPHKWSWVCFSSSQNAYKIIFIIFIWRFWMLFDVMSCYHVFL